MLSRVVQAVSVAVVFRASRLGRVVKASTAGLLPAEIFLSFQLLNAFQKHSDNAQQSGALH